MRQQGGHDREQLWADGFVERDAIQLLEELPILSQRNIVDTLEPGFGHSS
jgi:hypothetical protein